jgi:hypothetical protein
MAYAVTNHLRGVGCVRKADNVQPDTMTVDEICERFDLSPSMWKAVRNKCKELGIPLVHGYFDAYYIGKKGEEARTLIHGQEVIRGIAESLRDDFCYLGKNGTINDAQDYARITFNRSLYELPKMLHALGAKLPESVTKVLASGIED